MIEKPLPIRMREAADTLEEATRRYSELHRTVDAQSVDWRPSNLRSVAGVFEREDVKNDLMQIIYEMKGFQGPPSDVVANAILKRFDITHKAHDDQ
jgi:hypothetical protein